jgi:hypothetical protein
MSDLTANILRTSREMLGGVDTVYLFSYSKYSRSQIVVTGQVLTTFPTTTIYSAYSVNTNYSETTEVEGGDVAWNQNFSLEFPKTSVASEIYKFAKRQFRAIYVDYLGNMRILGLYNGLEATISNETGTSHSEFNGYRVSFTGKEDNQAYWVSDLETIFSFPTEYNNKVFMSGCNAIMQGGQNYIYQ